ncbi:hypothetical protein EDD85DRAFT_746707, partial [Armillaria nabsnona]
TLYATFVLATTLWCTLLIIFRIVTVAQAAGEVGRGLQAYYHTIEILIESSALYSIIFIVYLAFNAQNNLIMGYLDPLAAIARGVAPTFLIGHVAAGHACPDDSW